MARSALKPGSFSVSDRPGADGKYKLRGLRRDGTRVSMKVDTYTEGHKLGQTIFEGVQHATPVGTVTTPGAMPQLDEFGLPVDFKLPQVSADTIASVAPPTPQATPVPPPTAKEAERRKNAQTLCELIGMGSAAGVAMMSSRFLEARYEDVPKPSKKHLNDLADNVKKGLEGLFGDREVGPWTMVLLLTIGIPLAMWIQSSKPRKKKDEETTEPQPPLRSV